MNIEEQDHNIELEDAIVLTRNYRSQITERQYLGGAFNKKAFTDILNQDNCEGIRYYYGLDTDGLQVLVLVGIDKYGNDLHNGKLSETSLPCPSYCSTNNALNS